MRQIELERPSNKYHQNNLIAPDWGAVGRIPEDHPRYQSLVTREKLVAAGELVASAGLIAHGRGEAFDYLLGERTTGPAHRAINAAAGLLCNAKRPVISANGNTIALAAPAIAELAAVVPAQVEVNLFHHRAVASRPRERECREARDITSSPSSLQYWHFSPRK